MYAGLIYALAACALWGANFIMPEFLAEYSAAEVTIGRYACYGFLSLGLLAHKKKKIRSYSREIWSKALLFSLIANLIYYLALVVSVRYATAPVTVLLVGMCPIVAAFYGNWHSRECSFRSLILPCVWLILGMVLVNLAEVDWSFSRYSLGHYLLGLFSGITALVGWSWYAVNNACFLKKHPELPSTEWATVMGLATFFWALIFAALFFIGFHKELDFHKYAQFAEGGWRFWVGILSLGLGCSWLGCFFWNRASSVLPISLIGPLIILETLFGLLFVYLYETRVPSIIEILGIAAMLGGIFLSIYVSKQKMSQV